MIIELEQAVNAIACDIYDSVDCEYFDLTVKSNGLMYIVEFIGLQIWNSDDDMRDYIDEEEDIRVPIEDHLRKVIRDELRKLNMIKV